MSRSSCKTHDGSNERWKHERATITRWKSLSSVSLSLAFIVAATRVALLPLSVVTHCFTANRWEPCFPAIDYNHFHVTWAMFLIHLPHDTQTAHYCHSSSSVAVIWWHWSTYMDSNIELVSIAHWSTRRQGWKSRAYSTRWWLEPLRVVQRVTTKSRQSLSSLHH